ncbi:hypothetical protein [Enterobacter hormaechei]|uniref:hypothetical protein n=1 Tax=Enterobacter hormaechei TaxID=158836 RepID=UPI003F42D875
MVNKLFGVGHALIVSALATALAAAGWVLGGESASFISTGTLLTFGVTFCGLVAVGHADWVRNSHEMHNRIEQLRAALEQSEQREAMRKNAGQWSTPPAVFQFLMRESEAEIVRLRDQVMGYQQGENKAIKAINDVNTQLCQQLADAEQENDKLRATIKQDADTWRKQVSNLANSAIDLCKALDGVTFANEADAIAMADLRESLHGLALAGGVLPPPIADLAARLEKIGQTVSQARGLVAAINDGQAVPLKPWEALRDSGNAIEVTQGHWVLKGDPATPRCDGGIFVAPFEPISPDVYDERHKCDPEAFVKTVAQDLAGQQQKRREALAAIHDAISRGYNESPEFNTAYHRGGLYVTDELIASEYQRASAWIGSNTPDPDAVAAAEAPKGERAARIDYIERLVAQGMPRYFPGVPLVDLDFKQLAIEFDLAQNWQGDE